MYDVDDDDDPEILHPRRRAIDPAIRPPLVAVSVHGAYHALNGRLGQVVRRHGIGTSEALVLHRLSREGACAPAVIRHALGFHRSTLSTILGRLERDGLIEREADEWTGRRLDIRLTQPGELLGAMASEEILEVDRELALFTSDDERRALDAVFAACAAINQPDRELDI